MSYDGNEAGEFNAAQPPSQAPATASSPAVLLAANKLFEAALLIRQAGAIYATDIRDYLQPALQHLSAQVARAAEASRVPAVERPVPSIIQRGPDPAADILRGAARGQGVEFR